MAAAPKSIFAGTNIKFRQITLPTETRKAFSTQFAYERAHPIVTDEDLEEMHSIFTNEQRAAADFMPIRVTPSPRGIERIVSGNRRSHAQCSHYKQELLGGTPVYNLLNAVRNCDESRSPEYIPYKKYVSDNFQWLTTNFRYGFQVAYDIYTKHDISERAHSLHKEMEEEYEKLANTL